MALLSLHFTQQKRFQQTLSPPHFDVLDFSLRDYSKRAELEKKIL